MLAEALLYARARLAGQTGRHGHLAEQVGIWARHRRQGQAWAGHLARSRALCLRAAAACPAQARRTALVLGAGLLLDVPLAELARLFRRVVLADVSFLPATLRQARRLGNVECVRADLSACMDALPDAASLMAGRPAPEPELSLGLPGLDFVCSANLLSQMPLFALTALRRGLPQGPDSKTAQARREELLRAYAASLVRAHLRALSRLDCPACLVTDLRETALLDGRPQRESDLLFGVDPGLPGETWTWLLAPRGEAHPRFDLERTVLGAPDAHGAHGAHACPPVSLGGRDA